MSTFVGRCFFMNRTHRMVMISVYVAMALALDYVKSFIPFLNMSSGGSINIALIPIAVCSFHLGCFNGVVAGMLWWLVSSIMGLNPYFLNIVQYAADYIIPSGIVGLSSLFYRKKKIVEAEAGILLMMLIRTFFLVLSGAIFWSDEISWASWSYSLTYNLPYSLATCVMLMAVVPLVLRSFKNYL